MKDRREKETTGMKFLQQDNLGNNLRRTFEM